MRSFFSATIRRAMRAFGWIIFALPGKRRAPKSTHAKRQQRSKAHDGVHYYLGDLLDTLEDAFDGFRAFKKADPQAYKLFSQTGAAVSSSDGGVFTELDPYFKRGNLPSFACVHIGRAKDTKKERAPARFIYLRKIDKPINVQPTNLPVYRIGAIYTLHNSDKSVCCYGSISVDENGRVKPLKECVPVVQHLPGRKGNFVAMRWQYGRMEDWARDADKPLNQLLQDLFSIVANLAMQPESGLTVRVKKGRRAATFSIDMMRTPYFFSDRDKVVNKNGRTKRILHIVKTHKRVARDSQTHYVKSHFRGLRRFTWNGYDVAIGMAGKHFAGPLTFTESAAEIPNDSPVPPGMIGDKRFGKLLDAHMMNEAA